MLPCQYLDRAFYSLIIECSAVQKGMTSVASPRGLHRGPAIINHTLIYSSSAPFYINIQHWLVLSAAGSTTQSLYRDWVKYAVAPDSHSGCEQKRFAACLRWWWIGCVVVLHLSCLLAKIELDLRCDTWLSTYFTVTCESTAFLSFFSWEVTWGN